jgi:hypothetical protein
MSDVKTEVEREQRMWWVVDVDGGTVRLAKGYSCKPNSPNAWWFPMLGLSLSEGHHIFETKEEAVIKAIEVLELEIASSKITLRRLESMLNGPTRI